MKGGMVNDALREVDAVKAFINQAEEPRTEIKIRCRSCKVLNPEDAKFCNHCGQPV
jgi:rRNA maturation endonuclease Nob1